MKHFLKKLWSTIRIISTLAMAHTFGQYEVSVYGEGLNYAQYKWRGKRWAIPTGPIEEQEAFNHLLENWVNKNRRLT